MRQWKLSFRDKLLILGVTLTTGPLLLFGAFVWRQNSQFREAALHEGSRLAQSDLDHIAASVYTLCESSRGALERSVRESLNATRVLLTEAGGARFDAGSPVTWDAKNQFTKQVSRVALPKAMIRDVWLGQVRDLKVEVPVVDRIRRLTGVTSTIFQRMNAAGDMLRVATNVAGEDGARAIGTFIPATGADGKPNPVVSAVLRGETFIGRAWVVNAWYMAAYEPLHDGNRQIIGMLYVGVPEGTATEILRRAIMNIRIGNTGYVYVLNASGSSRGHYVVSSGGKRDGEDIWDSRDAAGKPFIQEICRKALALKPDEYATQQYPWKNAGESKVYQKVALIKYFQPWDWVIGVSLPEREFNQHVVVVEEISRKGTTILGVIGFVTIACTCALCLLLATRLSRRIDRIIHHLALSSEQMSSSATEVSSTSGRLAADAGEQAACNQEVSASLTQMDNVARQNMEHARNLTVFSAESRASAEQGTRQVQTMQDTVSQIQSGAADVMKINKLIDDIAWQTNILALNAAVEAARAGEAGLGFAVVAGEVRSLAHRSSEAARETSEKIQKSMQAGKQGVTVAVGLAKELERINASAHKVDELVQSIALASEEQTRGIAQISTTALEMSKRIQSTAMIADDNATRAREFSALAGDLEHLSAELRELFQGQ